MFIGEAPGKDEDLEGEPFVGKRAGQAGFILNERLAAIGLARSEVYITNLVKCRPTRVLRSRVIANRAPRKNEIKACMPWLAEEVRLVDPRLVVPLGVPATSRVIGRKVTMVEVHGRLIHGEGPIWGGREIISTYHPAGIRGNADRMRAFIQDFETIRDVHERLTC
jgi:uracil-DNA glycosylase family 4